MRSNWYDEGAIEKDPKELKDDTPYEIKANPLYKKMVLPFLTDKDKDEALETLKKVNAKATLYYDSQYENEKEHEGYYPNKLDDEMRHYTYGDKLTPNYWGWYPGSWDKD